MNPEIQQNPDQVMWLKNPTRSATPDERHYINGTMRKAMSQRVADFLGEQANTVKDRASRATHAVVWLGLTPSSPDIKLAETHDWWQMVNDVFDQASQPALQEK